jgi:4-diphosphocytidyl-2-C-methyl-D-erythritol kinase
LRLIIPCPAKINLFLAVGPKDERGFHPLRTIFQSIGLFDTLRIEPSPTGSDRILSDWPDLPEENTVAKALRLARELLPVPPLEVFLEKRIPSEAGLGGGSSDAAGLLRALRVLVSPPPREEFLFDVAAAVGKDVPFFLVGGRAKGEGYGERLTPLPDPDEIWYVVVRPDAPGSTKAAYARLDETAYPFLDFPEVGVLYNDFERVAPCESLEYLDVLGAYGASGSLLCGSGAAVFGVFAEEGSARMAAQRLSQDSRVQVWVAPSLGREASVRMEIVQENLK